MAGELRAPGLKTLLTQLAAAGHTGLCLLTSREWLQDLSEWVRKDTNPAIHPQDHPQGGHPPLRAMESEAKARSPR